MPNTYQNSAGNSSIANEYQNWRYFNANLQKLGNYQAGRVNIRVSDAVVQAATNYTDALYNVFQGGLGLFEARREAAAKEVDDWLSKHSLEEYHQLMKDNNVPFQDDPLAMQRLKYRHGRIQSYLAEQDFQARIDKGEFVGKEPEEIDKAHYEYLYKVMQEDSDVYPYKASGDYFYNQGFWENANANRETVFSKGQRVSDDYMKQDALLTAQSEIQGIIKSPNVSANAIYGKLQEFTEYNGFHFSPAERVAFFKGAIEVLGQTPYGHREIQKLADMKVPGMDSTFRDLFGDETIRQLDVQSHNLDYMFDRRLRQQDWTVAQEAIWAGDYPTLQKYWEQETALNGETDRADFFFKAVNQARTKWRADQKAKAAATAGQVEDELKDSLARLYVNNVNKDRQVKIHSDSKWWKEEAARQGIAIPDGIKITETDITRVFNDMWHSGKIKTKDLATGAARGNFNSLGVFNPSLSFVKSKIQSLNGKLDGVVKQIASGVSGANVIDENTLREFDEVAQIYIANPSAIAPYMSDSDLLRVGTMVALSTKGLPIQNQLVNMAIMAKNEEEGDFVRLENKVTRGILNNMDIVDLGETKSKIVKNPLNTANIMQVATQLYMQNGGKMDTALEDAADLMQESYYNFSGALIPKGFFMSSKYDTINPQYIAESIQKKVEANLTKAGVDESSVMVYIDKFDNNKLKVVDYYDTFKVYGEFSREDIENEAESYVNDRLKYVSGMSSRMRRQANEEFITSLGSGVN